MDNLLISKIAEEIYLSSGLNISAALKQAIQEYSERNEEGGQT